MPTLAARSDRNFRLFIFFYHPSLVIDFICLFLSADVFSVLLSVGAKEMERCDRVNNVKTRSP